MKIEIELQDYEGNQVEDRIIDLAAKEVMSNADISEAVHEKIDAVLAEAVEAKLNGYVDRIFSDIIQPTSTWGKPTGPAVSLEEHMIERSQSFLDEKVNKEGKLVTACNVGYNDYPTTRARWLVETIADRVWEKQLVGHVDGEIQKLAVQLKERAVASYAEKLHALLGEKAVASC